MRSNEFQHDEGDAVSPVIATILMVAITVVLAGVLYVWASSLAEGNTGGSLTFYQFDAEGDVGAITTGTDDPLVRITMTQGVAINWATVDVKISINNGAPITCDNPGNEGGAACALIEFGDSTDSEWSVGDGVTVVESGQDPLQRGLFGQDSPSPTSGKAVPSTNRLLPSKAVRTVRATPPPMDAHKPAIVVRTEFAMRTGPAVKMIRATTSKVPVDAQPMTTVVETNFATPMTGPATR